jgi:hypothetical protein
MDSTTLADFDELIDGSYVGDERRRDCGAGAGAVKVPAAITFLNKQQEVRLSLLAPGPS